MVTCECGHEEDEHRRAPGGHAGECDVPDCPCPLYDPMN